jgi:Holliday junction resolvase
MKESAMASNYARGARLERLARRALEAVGFVVTRSAGSKGVVDLVATNARTVRFIQVKAQGTIRPTDRLRLQGLPVPRGCSKEIWERQTGGKWKVQRVI